MKTIVIIFLLLISLQGRAGWEYRSANPVNHPKPSIAFGFSTVTGNSPGRIAPVKQLFAVFHGMKDTTVSPELSLYPNPVIQKKVFINSSSLDLGVYLIQVFSVSGKKVLHQELLLDKKQDEFMIRLPDKIKPGFYSLRLEGGTFNKRLTFVVK